MAPEQAEGSGAVDYRADLYALGATLFRLLCGRPPLAAAPNQSPFEKLRLLANHQPPKLSTLCPESSNDLAKLVASMLSRNPSDRPASAAHVAEQLAPFAEGSKLVELLQQANEKATASPDSLKKSPFPEHPRVFSSAPASLAPLQSSSGRGRSKTIRRLLLAASLPVILLAGVLIKLELSKGQLVIESDIENVSVKVLKGGQPVEGIQVSHGTTSTRLQADNYEITIDGPSDGLLIENGKFTLKNGQTVVVRIQHAPQATGQDAPGVSEAATEIPSTNSAAISATEPADPFRSQQQGQSNAPLYAGKPLEDWLRLLRLERGAEGLKLAIEACSALVTTENADEITDTLLSVLPELEEYLKGTETGSNNVRTLDLASRDLLRKANPGTQFFNVWVRTRTQSSDPKWNDRLVMMALPISPEFPESVEDLEPLVTWGRSVLSPTGASNPAMDLQMVADAAVLLRARVSLFFSGKNEEFAASVTRMLSECSGLSDAWWLSSRRAMAGSDMQQPPAGQ